MPVADNDIQMASGRTLRSPERRATTVHRHLPPVLGCIFGASMLQHLSKADRACAARVRASSRTQHILQNVKPSDPPIAMIKHKQANLIAAASEAAVYLLSMAYVSRMSTSGNMVYFPATKQRAATRVSRLIVTTELHLLLCRSEVLLHMLGAWRCAKKAPSRMPLRLLSAAAFWVAFCF